MCLCLRVFVFNNGKSKVNNVTDKLANKIDRKLKFPQHIQTYKHIRSTYAMHACMLITKLHSIKRLIACHMNILLSIIYIIFFIFTFSNNNKGVKMAPLPSNSHCNFIVFQIAYLIFSTIFFSPNSSLLSKHKLFA